MGFGVWGSRCKSPRLPDIVGGRVCSSCSWVSPVLRGLKKANLSLHGRGLKDKKILSAGSGESGSGLMVAARSLL